MPGPPPRAFAGPAAAAQPRKAPGRPGFVHSAAGVAQPSGGDSFAIDPGQLGLARGGGRPLPPTLLAKMEAAFGADFSGVRVHIGPQASRIGAIAFTTGNDLYFAPGQFQPESVKGQQLIGHELAHVIQQRQGRVRSPGSGMAVVQDRALEAEADRLGIRAAAHGLPVQAKMTGAGRGGPPVHISTPGGTASGSYRVTAGSGPNPIGSLVVHTKRGAAAEITDLGVAPGHRDQGIGRQLLESAARAGLRSGNSKLSLSAQDNGTGKLTRWYKDMGFRQVGVNGRGMPVLEAPIGRLLAGAAQPKLDPALHGVRSPRPPARLQSKGGAGAAPNDCHCSGPKTERPPALRPLVLQRAEGSKPPSTPVKLNMAKKGYRDDQGNPVLNPGKTGFVCAPTQDGQWDVCRSFSRVYWEGLNDLSAPGQKSVRDPGQLTVGNQARIITSESAVIPSDYKCFEKK